MSGQLAALSHITGAYMCSITMFLVMRWCWYRQTQHLNPRDQLLSLVWALTETNPCINSWASEAVPGQQQWSNQFVSSLLTQPDFSELPRSEFLHHLDGLFRNLPGAFVPRLLSFGFRARTVQFTTQAIGFAWKVNTKTLRTKGCLPQRSVLFDTGWHGQLFK